MRIETEIQVGEAAKAGRAVAARWGSTRWAVPVGVALGLVSTAAGLSIGAGVAALLDLSAGAGRILGFVLGFTLFWFVGLPAWRRVIQGRFKAKLAQHGVSGPIPTSYEITPQAFVYAAGGIVKSARWEVVSEVFGARGWWVLMIQGEAFYVPRRVFADEAQERAFISAVLDHMGEAARARSPDALRLVA